MLVMSSFVGANAQSSWIGGSISYSHQNREYDYNSAAQISGTTNSIGLSPSYRRDINNNWAYGLNLDVSFVKKDDSSVSNGSSNSKSYSKTQSYSFAPYLRCYWGSSEKLRFFINFSAFYGYNKDESESKTYLRPYTTTSSCSEYNRSGIGLNPGIEYRPNDRIALYSTIGSLNYNVAWHSGHYNHTINNVNFNLTSSISLGLMVRLGD